MTREIETFIKKMPKAELHLHIEGSLEPELKFKLAKRNDLKLPYGDASEMRDAYAFNDLSSFLSVYYEGMSVLLKEEDFYDLTMAYLVKASAQNVLYAEIFFDPQAHTSRGVAYETVIRGIRKAQEDGEKDLGIKTNLIMCFLRDFTAESAMETLEQSLPFKDWILGVGLDSDEKNNPPIKFKEVFDKAREVGYLTTMHCDVDQENTIDHIWQCLNDIKVDRIDHGVNALEDENLCEEIKKRGLGLTVCPISNKYVVADHKAKEIKTMLNKAMRVSVNSDDPAYFFGYINENLLAIGELEDFSKEDFIRLQENAFLSSWLPDDEKKGFVKMLKNFS